MDTRSSCLGSRINLTAGCSRKGGRTMKKTMVAALAAALTIGARNITRYEMAQMVAKAMAKGDLSASDRALVDRLAAEFADELNNLGVRVSNLERNADMVKWTGELRYRYWSRRDSNDHTAGVDSKKANTNQLQLRLFPTAEVNDHWKVKARLTASNNMKTFGNKVKVALEAGRWNLKNANKGIAAAATDTAANYQGIELSYSNGKLVNSGVSYRHFKSDAFKLVTNGYNTTGTAEDTAAIWSVGAKYAFDKNIALSAAYAKNTKADKLDHSSSFQLDYKGTKKSDMGSWGAYAAYRYVAANASLAPTYSTADLLANLTPYGMKGWDFGIGYVPFKNVLTQVQYFNGKELTTDDKVQTLYGRVSFFF